MTTTAIFFPQGSDDNNPYQRELANGLRNSGISVKGLSYRKLFLRDVLRYEKPIVLHLHWLHSFLVRTTVAKSLVSSMLFIAQLIILKLSGVKIIWTVHNLKNHDNQHLRLERFFTTVVAKLCNSIIVHGESVKNDVSEGLGLKNTSKLHTVPHGNYIGCYPNERSRESARTQLDLTSAPTFLFLGLIRPYKGVLELIDAFSSVNQPPAAYQSEKYLLEDYPSNVSVKPRTAIKPKLLIVGRIWSEDIEFKHQVLSKVDTTTDVTLISEFIPDEELQLYFNACDAVIFPYKDILTSGAVMLAMSFGKACVAPRLGCIQDTLDDEGSFLYSSEDPEGLTRSLQQAIEREADLAEKGKHNLQLANQFNWNRIGSMTANVYRA